MIESLLTEGLTETQIARFVEESPTSIQNIRYGKVTCPSYKTVKNLRRWRFHFTAKNASKQHAKLNKSSAYSTLDTQEHEK